MMKNNHAAASRKTKVVFVADNRNRENWGCRATSIALKEIIGEQCDIIYTIHGDITGSFNPEILHKSSIWTKIYKKIYNASNLTKSFCRIFDNTDIIRSSVRESIELYRKAVKHNIYFQDIDESIKQADAIVVNGEGTFIFSTPNRYDTIVYLLLLKIAQEFGKQTYCLNAMYSDYPSSPRNNAVITEAKDILEACTLVTARDPLSFDYCKKNITDNVKYVPDALFTWNKYQNYFNVTKDYPYITVSFPETNNKWIDFNEPYICLAGSSLAARYPQDAKKTYLQLAKKLNDTVMKTIIVSTCSGDNFLKDVANELEFPYVAVNTNIIAGMSILVNARAFVSGRWHPSILASIGGTPCVLMGSNSHKTIAIQNMLEYDNCKEYNAIPSPDDIVNIIKDTQRVIQQGESLRNMIKTLANKLGDEARKGNIL